MILLFILFLKLITSDSVNVNIPEPEAIPIVSEVKNECPCSLAKANLCRGGIYVDYYYNPPYSGYPKDATYLPPVDSIPVIVANLTSIRDTVKNFIKKVTKKDSNDKKAIYVKDNYSKVQHLLQAVDRAARKANVAEEVIKN